MKTKKMVAALLLVLGIVGFFATNASAVEANFTCTISRIGGYAEAANSQMFVTLENSAFPNGVLVCRIPDGRMNQIMAVLLTAASNGSSVLVRVDPAITQQSQRVLKFVYYNVD